MHILFGNKQDYKKIAHCVYGVETTVFDLSMFKILINTTNTFFKLKFNANKNCLTLSGRLVKTWYKYGHKIKLKLDTNMATRLS